MAGTGGLSALQISHTAKFLVIEEIKNAPDSLEVVPFFHFTMCRVCTIIVFNCSVGVLRQIIPYLINDFLLLSTTLDSQSSEVGMWTKKTSKLHHKHLQQGSTDWIRSGDLLVCGTCIIRWTFSWYFILHCGAHCDCLWYFVLSFFGILCSWLLLWW